MLVRGRRPARAPSPRRGRRATGIPSPLAEGVGFEPTVGCPTMVFETIRFGRSRIPPWRIVPVGAFRSAGRTAPRREELAQQRGAFVGAYTALDGEGVVESRVGVQVV